MMHPATTDTDSPGDHQPRHLALYLWRAVDQDGDVIDILLQPRRDRRAAERFFRKLLKGQGCEFRRLVTDKLRSYAAARHGKVQIHGPSARVLVGAWDHPESLPCRTPPAAGSRLPNTGGACRRCLERGDVRLTRPEVNRRWAGRAPASLS